MQKFISCHFGPKGNMRSKATEEFVINRGTTLALLAVALIVLSPASVHAWGANGHRITAKIGEDKLSPAARKAVRDLAGSESLAQLATWPDFIRSFKAWDCVKPWHFLTVEDDEFEKGMAQPASFFRSGCNENLFKDLEMPNNVVAAIDYFSAILGGDAKKARDFAKLLEDAKVDPYRGDVRLTALILIVHFIGDVHQPLHVGKGDDRGGNSVSVQWFSELTNLHSVWDSGLIDHEGLSYTEFARFLEQEFGSVTVDYGDGPATWAMESVTHRTQVYDLGIPPGANLAKLSYDYAAKQDALIKERLYQGGTRLAEHLNRIFDADRSRK